MQKIKNIVVITTDEQRWDSLGCYGHKVVKTPNIDQLAEKSVVFNNAFCCSTLCVPSRVGFYTGQYVKTNRAYDNSKTSHIDTEQWSYIQALHQKGYKIGLAGKNHNFDEACMAKYFCFREEYCHHGKQNGTITDLDAAVRKYRMNEKRPEHQTPSGMLLEGLIPDPEPFSENECMTWRIYEDAANFLEENKESPFLLHYSFPDPHWPQLACEPYHSMYMDQLDDIELDGLEIDWDSHPFAHYVQSQASGFDKYSCEDRKKILATYYGQITFIDKAVGALMDKLDDLGLRDSTMIVFTSDHGDLAGRFNLISKTKCFYEPVLRIPLIVHVPGIEQGRSDAQISNIDVMPTLAELLGIENPDCVEGKSFAKILDNPAAEHRSAIFAEVGNPNEPPKPIDKAEYPEYNRQRIKQDGAFWFIEYTTKGRSAMIRKENWKYCYYTGDMEELYDLENDELELHNLAEIPEHQERKEQLKAELMNWWKDGVGIGDW